MKNNNIYHLYCGLVLLLLASACGKGDYPIYNEEYTGIYFKEDSMHYSFSITPLNIEQYTLNVPVKIMGTPSKVERKFKVELTPKNTTAKAGVHYTALAGEFSILPDSLNGVLSINILRKDLEDSTWRVGIRLVENANFQPTNGILKDIIITFNNKVLPPPWKDWQGKPTWPDYKLGPWNPNTWVKFMELFREMETKAPSTYAAMVEAYGPTLDNSEYGWPYSYNYSLTKYVLIPMYDFFEAHPEYGVAVGEGGIPKPY